MDLLQRLTTRGRSANKSITKRHVLKDFFVDMGIPLHKIGEELGVSAMCISKWLNGVVKIPVERNKQLHDLAREIKSLIERNHHE